MNMPPAWLSIKVEKQRQKRVRLWLPLFILWPLILVLALLALLVAVVLDLVSRRIGKKNGYARFIVGCLGVLAASRGAQVLVDGKEQTVALTVR